MEEKLKAFNDKNITAACVLINPNGDILGCHATGKRKDRGWDFPKGLVHENETDEFAAMRELQEETGIWLYDQNGSWNMSHHMIDCGIYNHNKEKYIHIFLYQNLWFPDINTLKCNSFFELNGEKYPEVDDYKIISINERHMFNKVLQDKFEIIDKFNMYPRYCSFYFVN